MKTTLILLITCTALFAETRTEAELRKQLADAQAALSAEQARVKALSVGTQKLTEAVAVQAETGKANAQQIEEVKGKMDAAQVTDHKLVETVQTSTAETRKATTKLAEVVVTQSAVVTDAISAQAKKQERQQEANLRASREVALNLERANIDLAKKSEVDRIAKQQSDEQLRLVNHKLDVMTAEDKRGTDKDKWNFWTTAFPQIVVQVVVALGLLIGLLKVSLQVKDSKAHTGKQMTAIADVQSETLSKVNGRLDDLLETKVRLEKELEAYRRAAEGQS